MAGASSPSAVRGQIADWFGRVKLAGLELPSGWFGRPYGNLHRLTWSAAATRSVVLELDGQLLLTVTDPGPVSSDDRSLTVGSFAQLVFAWQEFANFRPHVDRFTSGSLHFWAQGANLP